MLKGLLVVNGFINEKLRIRFDNLYEMLDNAFNESKVKLDKISNDKLLNFINEKKHIEYDFVLFWDKDVNLAIHLENLGYKVYNSSKTYLALENKGIKMPKTIICPFTFANNYFNNFDFLDEVIEKLKLPLIIKEVNGSFGEQVYLCENKEKILEVIKQIFPKQFLFQEFISFSFGKDIRVEVVGDKVLGAVMRIQENGDFRSNVLQGGRMEKVNIDSSYLKMALDAIKYTGCSFGGVDILIGPNKEPILCEVNSNVHFKTFYKTTGVNLAKEVCEFILSDIK